MLILVRIWNYIWYVLKLLYSSLFKKNHSVISIEIHDKALCFIGLSFQIGNFKDPVKHRFIPRFGSLQFSNTVGTLRATIDFFLDIYSNAQSAEEWIPIPEYLFLLCRRLGTKTKKICFSSVGGC